TVLATDYVGARRIINGTDKASLIAGYAKAFETALKAAGYSSLKPSPGPISGPPSLDTPIPGAIQPAKPIAPPVPTVAAPTYVERNPFWAALFAFLKAIFGRK